MNDSARDPQGDNPIGEQIDDASAEELEHAQSVVDGIEDTDAHAADASDEDLADGAGSGA